MNRNSHLPNNNNTLYYSYAVSLLEHLNTNNLKGEGMMAREKAQLLKAPAALLEHVTEIPSTYMVAHSGM